MSLPLSPHHSVEVFVVDSPSVSALAEVALGAARTDAESTHVLCRHADEATPDFMRRVLRRLERIQQSRRVRSLSYVVGSQSARARGSARLLRSLMPMLESGSRLTVVGPRSCQRAVFECIDSIMDSTLGDISIQAQLYADGAGSAVPRSASRRVHPAAQHPVTAVRTLHPMTLHPLERFSAERFPMDMAPALGSDGAGA